MQDQDTDEFEVMEEIKLKKKDNGSFGELINKNLNSRQMDELFLDEQ